MIFVFGSNLNGHHGASAARFAHHHRGARMGVAEGHTGDAYALPTCGSWDRMSHRFPTLPLRIVQRHVDDFLSYARVHPELEFQVTRVGCGLAGYHDPQIAFLFTEAPPNCLFDDKWGIYLGGKRFWGTF